MRARMPLHCQEGTSLRRCATFVPWKYHTRPLRSVPLRGLPATLALPTLALPSTLRLRPPAVPSASCVDAGLE